MPTQVTYSEVWLSNGALQRIGAMTLIQSLDPTQDSSTNAIACGQWYPQCRDAILTDYPWTWAQGSAQLSQLNTMVPASPEYQYSYTYPQGALNIYAVVPTCPTSPIQGQVPQWPGANTQQIPWLDYWWRRSEGKPAPWGFRVNTSLTQGRMVMTDLPNATALYVQQILDPTQFAADFADLLMWRLAKELAYVIAISDAKRKVANDEYRKAASMTRARMMNEAQSDIPVTWPKSAFTRARF